MAVALIAPFAVAALVLCVAGLAKLRSPAGAVDALSVAGAPGGPAVVRAAAIVELALGGWSLVQPSVFSAGAVTVVYGAFCGLSLVLARRSASCGCFGAGDAPASAVQSALSAVLAVVALAAAVSGVHGVGWVLGTAGPGEGVVLAVALAGAVYATVLVYTELPRAWTAWGGR